MTSAIVMSMKNDSHSVSLDFELKVTMKKNMLLDQNLKIIVRYTVKSCSVSM